MPRPVHQRPDECLPTKPFSCEDAGRSNFFDLNGITLGPQHGDCAIVAVAYATDISYQHASHCLELDTMKYRPWRLR